MGRVGSQVESPLEELEAGLGWGGGMGFRNFKAFNLAPGIASLEQTELSLCVSVEVHLLP